jgi:N-acetylmuramoyl-L-alanine amidase
MRKTRTFAFAFVLIALLGAAPALSAQAPSSPISSGPATAPPAPRFAVVLDAAHGGSDAGGTLATQPGQTEPEKAYTLALSVRLRSLLGARGITVVTTRESDTAVDNNRRAEIANHANAAACISIHATQVGSGVHLYTSSLTPADPARLTPWKTAQAAWVTRSLALAGVVNSALTHGGIAVTLGRTALPAMDSMTCPAIAVEIAPQAGSDATQTRSLADPQYQIQIAQALAAAVLEWRSTSWRDNASSQEAQQP